MLSISLFCVAQGQRASDIPFDEREQTQWHVISGVVAESIDRRIGEEGLGAQGGKK